MVNKMCKALYVCICFSTFPFGKLLLKKFVIWENKNNKTFHFANEMLGLIWAQNIWGYDIFCEETDDFDIIEQ